jgi:ABC-type uncharacterized transport system substrate-binding protein
VVESGEEHGTTAARYALEILKGTPLRSLPIIKAHDGLKMINRETANRLGIALTDGDTKDVQIVPD